MAYFELLKFLMVGGVCYYLINAISWRRRMNGARSPPGPKGLPLLGNALDFALDPLLIPTFNKWADQYGPITQFNILGQKQVVLSTEKAADDLLVKRGSIYSDRGIGAATKVLVQGIFPALLDKNDLWRRQRKLLHSMMSIAVNQKFEPFMELESRKTLLDLLETPDDFEKHLGRYTYGVLTRSALGVKTRSMDDDFVTELESQGDFAVNTFRPDKYLSNLAPWLLKLPNWLFSENEILLQGHQRMMRLIKTLQDNLRSEISQGKAADSLHRYFLENQQEFDLSDPEGGAVFFTLLSAGTRSPHNALLGHIIATMQAPEWQDKLQKEVDDVVGPDRLPEFSDVPNLPTVRAVIKENIRWRSIKAEIGVPHKLSKDDFYEGYFFEKGTIFHANFSAMLQDKSVYPDGAVYNPARWLEPQYPTYKEPLTEYPNLQGFLSFGHGRRACPASNFTERSLTIMVARIAWAVTIKNKIDPVTKKECPLTIKYEPTPNPKPLPFSVDIVQRSKARLDLVRRSVQEGLRTDPLEQL